MLAVVEIGNSNIVFAVFEGESLKGQWRMRSELDRTGDEYALLLDGFLCGAAFDPSAINACALASVVQPLTPSLAHAVQATLNMVPLILESHSDFGIVNRCDPPASVGIDRLLNASAAFAQYVGPSIVVDLGTATTFDVVSSTGEFLGGSIAPGLRTAADALTAAAPRLGRIEAGLSKRAIGTNTAEALQSGVFLGYALMVDGMIARIRTELGTPAQTIVTGGQWQTLWDLCDSLDHAEPHLILNGIRLAYERSVKSSA